MPDSFISIQDIHKYFSFKEGFKTSYVKAVNGVSFDIYRGEIFGLVGESGCGKSTTGRIVLRLLSPTNGRIFFEGIDLETLDNKEMIRIRRRMQIIFQDPYASLNPRLRIRRIIEEPLLFHGFNNRKQRKELVDNTLQAVGLDVSSADRYPHEFSGGQQQRIGIARALVLKPEFIVCDEAVSALDVSMQAQVLNLLCELKKRFGLTYLFISHNLSVIKHICTRVGVMYLGRIVELAQTDKIFKNPLHPYTRMLISSIPIPDPTVRPRRVILDGDIPSPINPPSGCSFRTRCHECCDLCSKTDMPTLSEVEPGHFVACDLLQKQSNNIYKDGMYEKNY
jgi:oligopeptide/dipeptide ABC transporter ATP-binding protein